MTTIHQLFLAYVSHLERKGRDPKTVSRNRYALRRLNAWLRDAGVDARDAAEPLLEEYLAWLSANFAETTANSEATSVKSAYRYAVRLGAIERSPAENLEVPGVSHAEPPVFSNGELRLIRAALMDDLEEAIFSGLAYGGLRRHELCALKWIEHGQRDRNGHPINTVDFANQVMIVRGKGAKVRKVPIHPVLAEVLVGLHRNGTATVLGKGGSPRNVNHRLAKLLVRAGVDGGSRPAHRFRKTVATVFYEEGVQTDVIDRLMGWSPTSVRARYYTRIADERLYEAILKLYASDPIERAPLPATGTIRPSDPSLSGAVRAPTSTATASPSPTPSRTRAVPQLRAAGEDQLPSPSPSRSSLSTCASIA